MGRLQQINRNGSVVSSVNIPLDIIEKSGWKKGVNVNFDETVVSGKTVIVIYLVEDFPRGLDYEDNR